MYHGDFNFHHDDTSDEQVSRLKTLLSDHSLSQLVNVPTNKCGHILDWVVVHSDSTCLSSEGMWDCPDLSDNKVVICTLAVAMTPPCRHPVTSRNIRAVYPSDFQCDVRALVEAASQQCSNLDLVNVYNDGLCYLLDRHAQSVTRCMRDCPSAPWMAKEIREA